MKKRKRTALMGSESHLGSSEESGRKKIHSSPNFSQQWLKKFIKIQFTENYSPDRILPKIVFTPKNYKIVDNFVNSTEYFSNVITKNEQTQSADRSKMKI